MTSPGGEMPFLDHLEELRMRILRSLGAVVGGFALGVWLVERFQLVALLKAPIAPYLPDGRLTFTSPTEPLMIVLKLGFVVGLVLASPVLIWQVWAFLSPALYEKERRLVVPALVTGLALFLAGAAMGYLLVVPQALKVFFSFQADALQPMITYEKWFGFVLQIVLALGISFELPLVIIILAALGVVTPAGLHRFRRVAVAGSFVAGALLSPGADVFSMLLMTVPLLLLYEVGVAGAALIHRRRLRAQFPAVPTVLLLLAGLGGATPAVAQVPTRPPEARTDTTRAPPAQAIDSALAERLGLPSRPTQQFLPPDSAYRALLERKGYDVTRFRGDSAVLFVREKRLELEGRAMTERDSAVMEAEAITYDEASCAVDATGDPRLFGEGQVLVGEGLRYDTCRKRGVVQQALTNFSQGGTTWFIRGNVAKDSVDTRLYAGRSDLTSCDLPTPHYHFSARKVKWVSEDVLVARPVVLYVRDVPVLWLPFIFQDLKPGRHSGILIPQVGLNDIIRTSNTYNRQIVNVGYYWATNDYMDLTFRFDWFSRRYVAFGAQMNYRILNRFLSGSLAAERQNQVDGGSSLNFRWDHQQRFSLRSSINLSIQFATDARVVNDNAIDPIVNTQQVNSSLRYEKRFGWGNLAIGGNARQNLTDESFTAQLPSFAISPKPIAIGSNATWSPGLLVTNDLRLNQLQGTVVTFPPGGGVDTTERRVDERLLAVTFQTPVRVFDFNWNNVLRYTDQDFTGRDSVGFRVPDPSAPGDSVVVSRLYGGNFQSALDWDTGLNLPFLFRRSWKIQPILGVTNIAPGAFAIRNRNTDGDWVVQGKRAQLGLSATPTLFAFFDGSWLPGISRIRHGINPLINWTVAPKADVPEAYARAITPPGQTPVFESRAQNLLSVSLQQNFEAKARAAPDDSLGMRARKYRLLSWSISPFAYDFEQARDSGRSGWATQSLTNSFLSDLLPGFNLALGVDLWRGQAGVDTSRFAPFLQTVNANFSISSTTIQSILGGIGLAGRPDARTSGQPSDAERVTNFQTDLGRRPIRPGSFGANENTLLQRRRGFTSSWSFTLQRVRESSVPEGQAKPPDRIGMNYSLAFSPTPFWGVSWTGQYNFTNGKLESTTLRLERDLHEWRAAFSFIRNANGNVAFFFSIFLSDLPDLRWDYQQTTFER